MRLKSMAVLRRLRPRDVPTQLVPRRRDLFHSFSWDMSATLGWIAAVIVLICSVWLVWGGRVHIHAVMPQSVRRALAIAEEAEVVDRKTANEFAGKVRTAIASRNRTGAAASPAFSMGSTEEEVRRVQGPPDRIVDGTWYYGASEVHFAAGVVISWRTTAERPLRAR